MSKDKRKTLRPVVVCLDHRVLPAAPSESRVLCAAFAIRADESVDHAQASLRLLPISFLSQRSAAAIKLPTLSIAQVAPSLLSLGSLARSSNQTARGSAVWSGASLPSRFLPERARVVADSRISPAENAGRRGVGANLFSSAL